MCVCVRESGSEWEEMTLPPTQHRVPHLRSVLDPSRPYALLLSTTRPDWPPIHFYPRRFSRASYGLATVLHIPLPVVVVIVVSAVVRNSEREREIG